MSKRTHTIGIRVSPEVKSAAVKAANDDNRSISSLIETVLIDYLSSEGYLDWQRKKSAVPPGTGAPTPNPVP